MKSVRLGYRDSVIIVLILSLFISPVFAGGCDNTNGGTQPGAHSLGCAYVTHINIGNITPMGWLCNVWGETPAGADNVFYGGGGVSSGTFTTAFGNGTYAISSSGKRVTFTFLNYTGQSLTGRRKEKVYTTPQVYCNGNGWRPGEHYELHANTSVDGFTVDTNAPAQATGDYVYQGSYGSVWQYGENPHEAVLEAVPTSGNLPLTVAFTDDSAGFGSGDTYSLDFNDGYYSEGNYSSNMTLFHTYYFDGTYNVTYTVTHSATPYSDVQTITVSEAENGTSNYYVQVAGVNTQVIEGATVEISYPGGSDSEETGAIGRAYFTVPANRMVTGTVNKDGYQEATFSQYVSTWPTWTPVTLYTDNETPSGGGETYANLILTISNRDTGQPITNTPVFVKIYSDSGYTELFESGVTYTGTYIALIPTNTTYYFKLSAAVYADGLFSTSIAEATYLTKYLTPINPGSDLDGDGTPDMWDDDVDGDGLDNDIDPDDDNDGINDGDDETPGGGTQTVLQPTIHIWAYSTTGVPISGALVTITSDTDSGSTVTTPNGTAYYFCADLIQGNSRTYTISVHHGAYTDQNASITVSTQNPSLTFYMVSSTVQPSVTATIPAYTPPQTPFWSGTNGTPGNMQEAIFNWTIGTLGISFQASGMLLGLIICIVCAAIVGGASNSGMGAMIGGGFGWLAAGVMGYIPAWAIIVSVALVVMAFFIMRGSGNED